jgi:hypothetical protein
MDELKERLGKMEERELIKKSFLACPFDGAYTPVMGKSHPCHLNPAVRRPGLDSRRSSVMSGLKAKILTPPLEVEMAGE